MLCLDFQVIKLLLRGSTMEPTLPKESGWRVSITANALLRGSTSEA